MQIINDTISAVRIGTPTTFRNLTLFPLSSGNGKQADYLTLDEALAQKSARITEVSEGGSVPNLKFFNEGDKPVFVLDGEELIGAKQNRVINLSILVAAGKVVIIPVSCVEAGRWHHKSREFSSAPRAQYAEGRAQKMASVTQSMESSGERYSDQGEVWQGIGLKFAKFGFSSPTSAMSEIYERETVRLEEYVQAFSPADGQVGAMFAINGKIVGFDLFDSAETLRKLFQKILRSYALDALDALMSAKQQEFPFAVEDAEAFLGSVKEAEVKTFAAVGEGQDVRLTGKGLTGAALVTEERVVHLSAFRLNDRPANAR